LDGKVIKIIAALGWILVGVGAMFTIWAFILFLRSSSPLSEPIMIVFFVGMIFCSIAAGMFFVVLSLILRIMKNIERNTAKESNV